MNKWKFFTAIALTLAALAPTLATAADMGVYPRHHHYRHYGYHRFGLPYPISYLHNYGPGFQPGTFAFYDGPSTNFCYQGSAAYIGQDNRRHPCF